MSDTRAPHSGRPGLAEPVAVSLLCQASAAELPAVVSRVLAGAPAYDETLLSACLAALDAVEQQHDSLDLARYLAEDSPWCRTALGQWIVARLLETGGACGAALAAWDRVIDHEAGPLHEAYLCRARLKAQDGDAAHAFTDLRRAVTGQEDYRFLAKAAKLYARLRSRHSPPAVRRIRLALLSSTTTDLAAPLLGLACFRDWIDADLYVAPYGSYRQSILDPDSGLYAFEPDVVVIATHWQDAGLPPDSDAPEEQIGRVVAEFSQLWEQLLERRPCFVVQHNFDLPAIDPYGHLGRVSSGGRGRMLRVLNRLLVDAVPTPVAVLDLDHVSAEYGKRAWLDPSQWHLARQYPAAAALPLLVDHQVALIRAGIGLSRKVLVLDLDNTLWGGVIGEDGLEGIELGPPSAVGEAHQALQCYAAALKARGIVLGVCSKNNDEDARLPFLHHEEMALRLDDIAAFTANWDDKPANLRLMAEHLGLGLDSFVFLDDNPVERALVRRELPEVAVPEVGPDPGTFVPALDRGLYFEGLRLSWEDRERHRTYRANGLRNQLRASSGSLADFLRGLEMEAEAGPFDESVLGRVVQLIGKTNQFNLTTRRHSEEQVRRLMASAACWTQYFRLRDRFGDSGIVGVMMALRDCADPHLWEIDTWLMSCRVIGRGVEDAMIETAAAAVRALGARALRGVYVPTAKNTMVRDLYPRLGFAPLPQSTGEEASYLLDLTTGAPARPHFIRLRSAP